MYKIKNVRIKDPLAKAKKQWNEEKDRTQFYDLMKRKLSYIKEITAVRHYGTSGPRPERLEVEYEAITGDRVIENFYAGQRVLFIDSFPDSLCHGTIRFLNQSISLFESKIILPSMISIEVEEDLKPGWCDRVIHQLDFSSVLSLNEEKYFEFMKKRIDSLNQK